MWGVFETGRGAKGSWDGREARKRVGVQEGVDTELDSLLKPKWTLVGDPPAPGTPVAAAAIKRKAAKL